MADLTVRDLYEIMAREYKGRDPSPFLAEQFPRGTRWVMDLASYKRVRAACAAAGAVYPEGNDPEAWVPHPGDQLFGLPVEVRENGGEPHLEEPPGG